MINTCISEQTVILTDLTGSLLNRQLLAAFEAVAASGTDESYKLWMKVTYIFIYISLINPTLLTEHQPSERPLHAYCCAQFVNEFVNA